MLDAENVSNHPQISASDLEETLVIPLRESSSCRVQVLEVKAITQTKTSVVYSWQAVAEVRKCL